ncbi:MAG TPA: hypothetical protein VI455_05535 [Terriglobia bacterium]
MPDFNFLMDSRLRPEQLRVVNQLGRLAANRGLNLYLTGGAVRDLTLGASSPRNLHFVVEGNVQKILRPLDSKAGRHSPAHPAAHQGDAPALDLHAESVSLDSKLNRAQVLFDKGVRAEISTARNEAYLSTGRPPVISPGSIFDDLRRRDFSVNAMAVSLHPNSRGLLLDPTNGAADIERKELRVLHSRSFFDDPSRIYRLLRLCQRLDFKPDEKTERWLGMALEERTWQSLTEQAQGAELRAILQEESSGKLLKILRDKGLIAGLDRKLTAVRVDFDKFERIRAAARTAGAEEEDVLVLNFHELVARLPGAEQNRLARKVLGDAKTIKLALGLEREAAKVAKLVGSAKLAKPSQAYAVLADTQRPLILFLLVHHTQTTIQNRVKAFLTKFPAIRAALPRAELESLGLPLGPKFDKVLEQVFLDELDGKIKNPQQMTKALLSYAGIKAPPPPPPAPIKTAAPKAKAPKAAKVEAQLVEAPKVEGPKGPAKAIAPPKALPAQAARPLISKALPSNVAPGKQKPKPEPQPKPQPRAPRAAPAKPRPAEALKAVPSPKNMMPRSAAKSAPTAKPKAVKSAAKPIAKAGVKPKPQNQKARTKAKGAKRR